MNLQRTLIHAGLYLPYLFRKITGTGTFGRRGPVYLRATKTVSEANPLKAALFKHHVKQFSESACSAATLATVINALREVQGNTNKPVTQQELLDRVRTANWKERLSSNGFHGRRGLPLPLLARVVETSLSVYKIAYQSIETVQTVNDPARSVPVKAVLFERLQNFETKGDSLMIIHFDQGAVVPTLNIPHISPVGGFDPSTGDVIILDVDPEQERLYKTSFTTFYKGLSSDYHHLFKHFGYGSGGYVYVKLK